VGATHRYRPGCNRPRPAGRGRALRGVLVACAAVLTAACGTGAPGSGATATSAPPPSPRPAVVQSGDEYVALGSSFASGPGLDPVVDEGCLRSQDNYAHQVAAELQLELTDVSCGGATTENVLTEPQQPDTVRPPQLEAVTPGTEVITITIGGNDVQYVSGLERFACIAAGGCPESSVDRRAIVAELDAAPARLTTTLEAIRATAPGARVLLVSYPRIVPATGEGCPSLPLTNEQIEFARTVGERLDAAFRDAAARTGSELVDVYAASSARGACEPDRPWVNGVPTYTEGSGTAFHPTESGMRATAQLVVGALA
jgi:lysophospholipase L1-like esterase